VSYETITIGNLERVTGGETRRRFIGMLVGLYLGTTARLILFGPNEVSARTRQHRKKRRGRRANDRSPDVQAEMHEKDLR
jgi:hypothetical protein